MTKKRHKKRRKLKIGRILFLLVLIFGIYVFFRYQNGIKAPQKQEEEVSYTVPTGAVFKNVLDDMEKNGLIKDSQVAYWYLRYHKLTDIKAGEYVLNKSWDLETMFTVLNDSTKAITDQVTVTIVEGDWAKHIAKKVSEVTNVTEEELMNLWNDEAYIRSLMPSYPFLTEELFQEDARVYLEGYLAPNTYNLFPETTPQDVTTKLLDEQLKIYNQLKDDIASQSLTIHELYTLASVVQYEAGDIENMKKIAGVFYNRLNIGMPLQSSSTVCYAIDFERGDDWMNCEVNSEFESPYNTYKYGGLPPGPIVNPGADAIEATIHPIETNYLYFMADVKGDGTIYYAETLEEHERNVSKYLR